MKACFTIFKREFLGYFRTPVAYVFLCVFLLASMGLPWYIGHFFSGNDASLKSLFDFIPWIFLILIPAVGMRLWAEEKRLGTWELILTMPLSTFNAVLGKFLAGWAFIAIAILLTFSMPMTITYLGDPDWGPIVSGYLGSILMAGGYLGICSLTSSFTRNQVISFVLSLTICLFLLLLGWSVFNNLMIAMNFPVWLVDTLANFSFITHFTSLSKGLLRLEDILFFLSLIAFCIAVNTLIIEGNKKGRFSLSIPLLVIGLFLVNFIGKTIPVQLDLTEKKLYTLSDGTRNLLSKLEEPIVLKFYYSQSIEGLPISFKNFALRVEDLLRQYKLASKGQVRLEVVNPKPDSSEEEQAVRAGVAGQDLANGEKLFFGLQIVMAHKEKVIPQFNLQRESFLEIDISQLIYQVQLDKLPTLGIMTSLDIFGGRVHMGEARKPKIFPEWTLLKELRYNFNVVNVGKDIPEEIDLLAVIHPQYPSEEIQFAIDQFLLSGKPVFIAVDPSSIIAKNKFQQLGRMGSWEVSSSNLPTLFKAWGIEFNEGEVVGDLLNATEITRTKGAQSQPYPVWLTIDKFDKSHPITAPLNQILFAEAGKFEINTPANIKTVALIETSNQSDEMMSSIIANSSTRQLNTQIISDGKKRSLATMLTGKFKTAFPDGKPRFNQSDEEEFIALLNKDESIKESIGDESTLVLISDTDLLSDQFSIQRFNNMGQDAFRPRNDNLAFFINLLEFLSGGNDLSSLRSKGTSSRPFKVIREMELNASKVYQTKLDQLENELQAVQAQLAKIKAVNDQKKQLITDPEVQSSLLMFQIKEAELRSKKREIRKGLRENIEKIDRNLAFLNLLTMPAFIIILGINFFYIRNKKTQTARKTN